MEEELNEEVNGMIASLLSVTEHSMPRLTVNGGKASCWNREVETLGKEGMAED